MQFIIHGHPSSLKTSFESELDSLNFNMVSDSLLLAVPPIVVHVFGWLYKPWASSLKASLGNTSNKIEKPNYKNEKELFFMSFCFSFLF